MALMTTHSVYGSPIRDSKALCVANRTRSILESHILPLASLASDPLEQNCSVTVLQMRCVRAAWLGPTFIRQ
jgi:hypothetical protein